MPRTDRNGHTLTGATADAADIYDTALHELQCYQGDPVATIDRTLMDNPEFVMGHALRAYLHLLGTEPEGPDAARESLHAGTGVHATPRESAHLHAVEQIADGHWYASSRTLEDISIEHPHDTLALQAGHLTDFLTGASRMLRAGGIGEACYNSLSASASSDPMTSSRQPNGSNSARKASGSGVVMRTA